MPDELIIDMGKRIAARRKQLRLTQDDLAELAEVTPQMISTAELGKKALRPENILKLSTALEVSADYLLTGQIIDKDVFLLDQQIATLSPEQFRCLEDIIHSFLKVCTSSQ